MCGCWSRALGGSPGEPVGGDAGIELGRQELEDDGAVEGGFGGEEHARHAARRARGRCRRWCPRPTEARSAGPVMELWGGRRYLAGGGGGRQSGSYGIDGRTLVLRSSLRLLSCS